MKKFILTTGSAAILGFMTLVPVHSIFAQAAVVQSTPETATVSTTATGTITQINGGMIYIKTDGAPDPLVFQLTGTTSFVDDQDAAVQPASLKRGRAVMVFYVMNEGNKVATKVLVRNAP